MFQPETVIRGTCFRWNILNVNEGHNLVNRHRRLGRILDLDNILLT